MQEALRTDVAETIERAAYESAARLEDLDQMHRAGEISAETAKLRMRRELRCLCRQIAKALARELVTRAVEGIIAQSPTVNGERDPDTDAEA